MLSTIVDVATELRPGALIMGRVRGFPWWPAVVAVDDKSSTWIQQDDDASARVWCSFFNDKTGAWLKAAELKPYNIRNREECMLANKKNDRHRKHLARIGQALVFAEDFAAQNGLNIGSPLCPNDVLGLAERSNEEPDAFVPWANEVPSPPGSPGPPSSPHIEENGTAGGASKGGNAPSVPSGSSGSAQPPVRETVSTPSDEVARIAQEREEPTRPPRRSSRRLSEPLRKTPVVAMESGSGDGNIEALDAVSGGCPGGGDLTPNAQAVEMNVNDGARPRRKRTRNVRYEGFEDPFHRGGRGRGAGKKLRVKTEPRKNSDLEPTCEGTGKAESPGDPSKSLGPVALRNTARVSLNGVPKPVQKSRGRGKRSMSLNAPSMTKDLNAPSMAKERSAPVALSDEQGAQQKSTPAPLDAPVANTELRPSRQSLRSGKAHRVVSASRPPRATPALPPAGAAHGGDVEATNGSKPHEPVADLSAAADLSQKRKLLEAELSSVRMGKANAIARRKIPLRRRALSHSILPNGGANTPAEGLVLSRAATGEGVAGGSNGEAKDGGPQSSKFMRLCLGGSHANASNIVKVKKSGLSLRSSKTNGSNKRGEGSDTDSEPDADQGSPAVRLEQTASGHIFRDEGCVVAPGPTTGAGIVSSDALGSLLKRVSDLEADVGSLKARAATEEQARLGEDATAAGLKAAVEALASASAAFAEKRDFNSGVIRRALDSMWPNGELPLTGSDGEILRSLARSLVMANCRRRAASKTAEPESAEPSA